LLPLPRGKEALHYCLHAAASVLADNGHVLLYGMNDLGIKSAGKVAGGIFASVECIHTGNHGRIWRLAKPDTKVVKNKPDDFASGTPPHVTYPGLFAGGKLDDSTALLIANLPHINSNAAVLDFACGIGVIAAAVRRAQPTCRIAAVDHDPLALLATARNVPDVTCQLMGQPVGITGTYDYVFSNPPIHEGNTQSFHIVHDLVMALPQLLNKGGAAYIVAQVTVPVARLAKEARLECSAVAATRSFRVSCVTRD